MAIHVCGERGRRAVSVPHAHDSIEASALPAAGRDALRGSTNDPVAAERALRVREKLVQSMSEALPELQRLIIAMMMGCRV